MKKPQAIALSLAAFAIGVPLAHGVVPWGIGRLPPHVPGPWGWLGLLLLASGAALLAWVAATAFASLGALPDDVALDWRPKLFVTGGPYARTRNPMYVGELALWLGWALWLGSPWVLLGAVLLFVAMQRIIRREERDLATQFGDAYRAYCCAVPRWLAKGTS